MCTNNVANPWGLQENSRFKCTPNILTCCPCLFKNGKVADVNSLPLSRQSTPVLAITLPPESREK